MDDESGFDLKMIVLFDDFIDRLVTLVYEFYSKSREELISSQSVALHHDTPVVSISEGVCLMPLMGIIDTARSKKIIETLLEYSVENKKILAIMDMTGVATFDTSVAKSILSMIDAAKLIGTKVILSGITPSVAVTIVKLGVHLGHVKTFNTVENAISYTENSKDPMQARHSTV